MWALTALLAKGVSESARVNTVMVFFKVLELVFFFAYIGFDAISTGSEESSNPKRDLPVAIVGSLLIATVVYVLVAIAAAGALPSDELTASSAPLAQALESGAGIPWAAAVLAFGAVVAITSVILVILYGQTRIMFAICRDGLAPRAFAKLNPRTGTPVRLTRTFGIFIAVLAALVPLSEIIKLVNIGTLFAFMLVNVGVLVLRRTRPDMERPFRVPFSPVFPLIGIALCILLTLDLPATTWIRCLLWLAAGTLIYIFYGYRHSRLRTESGV